MAAPPPLAFGELLRHHRTTVGLTQEELAEKARLSVDAISTLERGARRTPRKETVTLLADALGLSPNDRAAFIAAATAARLFPAKAPESISSENIVQDTVDVQSAPTATTTDAKLPRSIVNFGAIMRFATRPSMIPVVALTLATLTIVGQLLPFVIPTFPRALGWIAGLGGLVLLVSLALNRKRHPQFLQRQWRRVRPPILALTSGSLSLVIVLSTLFITTITTPRQVATLQQQSGYDFNYTYHKPTHIGGSVVIGIPQSMQTLAPNGLGKGLEQVISPIWPSCITQLPDLKLGLAGWKADQCSDVPTVDNGQESADETMTTFHIDPRAVWSDGVPITADDFLFGERLVADPNITGEAAEQAPWNLMTITALNPHTVQIHWAKPYADYLNALWEITPLPLHVYGRGQFANVYDPRTGAYNSELAQQLRNTAAFNTAIPVDNGAFLVQKFVPDQEIVLVRNSRFFSNYFHTPALDKITMLSTFQDFPFQSDMRQSDMIGKYRQGLLDLALELEPLTLSQVDDLPKDQVLVSPTLNTTELGFNQRSQAPNARANGGVSIFTDHEVRQAFVEAFDRCAAVRGLFGEIPCDDANLFTDEAMTSAPDITFDPTFRLPAYNPDDAARLMERAGYRVVDGVRRYRDGVTPLQITLHVSQGASLGVEIARRIQQDYLRNLQISVAVVNVPVLGDDLISGAFDLILWATQVSPDPILRLTWNLGPFDSAHILSQQHPDVWNPLGIIDAQANERDQLAAQTLSDEQRTAILQSLVRYFSQQYYVEEVYIWADVSLKKPTLCNFKHWPTPGLDLWNFSDWYIAPTCP